MARKPRRRVVGLETLLATLLTADSNLAQHDAMWRGLGYRPTSAQLSRTRDGSYSARVVWRKRDGMLCTICYEVRGLILA